MLAVLSVEHGPGADACMSQPALTRSVERRLKRRVFVSAAEASLRLRVSFVQRDAEIEARIELASTDGTPRGTRSLLTTGHCSKLDDSLALSVALLVDQPPEPEPAATPSPSPAAEGSPQSPRARVIVIPPEVMAPREPWRLAVGVAAKGGFGLLPGISPAAVAALRLLPGSFPSILLQGEAFWPATAERDDDSGARFRLLRVGLAVCPELVAGPGASFGLCVGQQVAWLSVEGYGFDHVAERQHRLGYALTAGGEAGLRLFPPVSLRGYLGVEVPLARDRFTSGGRNAQELFRATPLGVVAEIGLQASLWQ